MKKLGLFCTALLLVIVCAVLVPTPAKAASESDLTFRSHAGGGYYLTKCNGSATGELVIPATYNGKPVTHISDEAFAFCSGLTSIVIPDSVMYIGEFAFYDCSNLTNVTISTSVREIGDAAFKECTSLKSITIPGNVTRIGSSAFYGCSNLTSISLADGLKTIGSCAFQYCRSLTDITLPDSLYYLGSWAFDGCTKLTRINIPGHVTKIDQYTFQNCKALTDITIADRVNTIVHHAFLNCNSLTNVVYCGTEDQWNNITIDGHNENLTQATRSYHKWLAAVSGLTCAVCGETSDGHLHEWQNATCTVPQTCILCGLTNGTTKAHNYDNGMVTKPATCKDEGIRTYACLNCSNTKTEKITKLTTHTYDNSCDAFCNVCNQQRIIQHTYKTIWSQNIAEHWRECSICKDRNEISEHVPGAKPTETTPQTCQICGYEVAPALGVPPTQPTEPSVQPTEPPETEPSTQPSEPQMTEPATEPTEPPATEPATEPTEPQAAEPNPPAEQTAVSLITVLLVMLAEAVILCTVFLILWKKKR